MKAKVSLSAHPRSLTERRLSTPCTSAPSPCHPPCDRWHPFFPKMGRALREQPPPVNPRHKTPDGVHAVPKYRRKRITMHHPAYLCILTEKPCSERAQNGTQSGGKQAFPGPPLSLRFTASDLYRFPRLCAMKQRRFPQRESPRRCILRGVNATQTVKSVATRNEVQPKHKYGVAHYGDHTFRNNRQCFEAGTGKA